MPHGALLAIIVLHGPDQILSIWGPSHLKPEWGIFLSSLLQDSRSSDSCHRCCSCTGLSVASYDIKPRGDHRGYARQTLCNMQHLVGQSMSSSQMAISSSWHANFCMPTLASQQPPLTISSEGTGDIDNRQCTGAPCRLLPTTISIATYCMKWGALQTDQQHKSLQVFVS